MSVNLSTQRIRRNPVPVQECKINESLSIHFDRSFRVHSIEKIRLPGVVKRTIVIRVAVLSIILRIQIIFVPFVARPSKYNLDIFLKDFVFKKRHSLFFLPK